MLKLTHNSKRDNRPELAGVTPQATTRWAKVFTPDTHFDAAGVYSATLLFNPDDKGVADMFSQLGDLMESAKDLAESTCKTAVAKKNIKKALSPRGEASFGEELDDDGNTTGLLFIKVKNKASGETDGHKWTRAMPVFDISGNLIPASAGINVGNGSLVDAEICAYPYYSPVFGYGVTIQLRSMRIKKLVEFNGVDAGSRGYDIDETDESGYTFSNEGAEVSTTEDPTFINPNKSDDGGDY